MQAEVEHTEHVPGYREQIRLELSVEVLSQISCQLDMLFLIFSYWDLSRTIESAFQCFFA